MRGRWSAAWLVALAPAVAHAHLLPRQTATVKLVDRSAFAVVSVPASALDGVDDDGDGLVSPVELARHEDEITRQVAAGFEVGGGERPGTRSFATASLPHTDGDAGGSDYVVVLQRTDFEAPVAHPTVTFRLFGTGEARLVVKASLGDRVEVAMLTATEPSHLFSLD